MNRLAMPQSKQSKASPSGLPCNNRHKSAGRHTYAVIAERFRDEKRANGRLWVDTRRGYVITRRLFLDAKTGRPVDEIVTDYRRHSRVWYPWRVSDRQYDYISQGKRVQRYVEETTAKSVLLNPRLTALETGFGRVPRDTIVQDNRFGKPIVYRQKEIQYTDQQLAEIAKGTRPNPGTD